MISCRQGKMSLADELLADLEENDNYDLEEKLNVKEEPIEEDEVDTKEHVVAEPMEIDVSVSGSFHFLLSPASEC